MALVHPIEKSGVMRKWELATTAITGASDGDTAEAGLSHVVGSIYVITSSAPLLTLQIQESPDNINWVVVDEQVIRGNVAYRINHPFMYLKPVVSAHTSGQIDSIIFLGSIR